MLSTHNPKEERREEMDMQRYCHAIFVANFPEFRDSCGIVAIKIEQGSPAAQQSSRDFHHAIRIQTHSGQAGAEWKEASKPSQHDGCSSTWRLPDGCHPWPCGLLIVYWQKLLRSRTRTSSRRASLGDHKRHAFDATQNPVHEDTSFRRDESCCRVCRLVQKSLKLDSRLNKARTRSAHFP